MLSISSPTADVLLPLHFGVSLIDSLLVVALGIGTVFSVLVALLSFAAFVKRRTVSYLLITVAFSTVLGKTGLGLVYLTGGMDSNMRHSFEHSLDVVMMVLVLTAVYYARTSKGRKLRSN